MGTSDKRALLDLEADAISQGWRRKRTRGGHVRLMSGDGASSVTLPSTPSDHRSVANARSSLRRAGLKSPQRPGRAPRRTHDNSVTRKVLAALEAEPGREFSVGELCERFGVRGNTISRALYNLGPAKQGRVVRTGKNRWRFWSGPPGRIPLPVVEPHPETPGTEYDAAPLTPGDMVVTRPSRRRAAGDLVFEIVTVDRLGRLVLQDDQGDIWCAMPMKPVRARA